MYNNINFSTTRATPIVYNIDFYRLFDSYPLPTSYVYEVLYPCTGGGYAPHNLFVTKHGVKVIRKENLNLAFQNPTEFSVSDHAHFLRYTHISSMPEFPHWCKKEIAKECFELFLKQFPDMDKFVEFCKDTKQL